MSQVIVTGATGGIGLEFCRHYLNQGHQVMGVCRKANHDLKALNGIEVLEVGDLTSQDARLKVKQALGSRKVDLLINNAGLLESGGLHEFDPESIRRQFEINALTPILLSRELLDHFQKPAKIAMITSRMGSIADNTSGSYYGYRASKTALNMMSVSLASDVKDRQIWVGIYHPGFVRTKMTGGMGDIDPKQSVQGLVALIEGLNEAKTGTFWHTNGEPLPW